VLKSVPDHRNKSLQKDPTLQEQFPDASAVHLATIDAVSNLTMTSPDRILALCQAVEHVVRNNISGALVECGVWRGGSMVAAAKTLLQNGVSDRELWLFDTFDGMSSPSELDVDFRGRPAIELMETADRRDPRSVWCGGASLEQVRRAVDQTGYPANRVQYRVGPVERTLFGELPDAIAVLRLDTDWYESTMVELRQLFPRLSPGGVLIIDDYGHWNGCRRAVDEYFQEHGIGMFLNRIDYTGRLGIHWPIENLCRDHSIRHPVAEACCDS
jgi:hypothetical protein